MKTISLKIPKVADETLPTTNGTEIAISVRHLSKMYRLYAKPSHRLKQSLWYALPPFLRGRRSPEFYKEFWALRDVSFEVKKGETVGIIGRNGSGKSTLLQIIAGTLAPTEGEVQVNGRVAALLELGSGFNPEFTGRENVYLNGAIWGLQKSEIDAIFEDIAAFADIGQFIDQPVKLYSSGMFVRLAFAVQVFVPKEIFVVDEALAVGDEAFQRKCMAALDKFRDQGGTVLLVSHDIQTIIRQCNRCLLLHQGQLIASGASKPVTDLYQKLMYSNSRQLAELLAVVRETGWQQALAHSKTVGINQTPDHTTASLKPVKQDTSSDQPETEGWFDPALPQPKTTVYGNARVNVIDYGMYTEQGERVNVLIAGRRYRWSYTVKFEETVQRVHFGMMIKTVDGIDVAGVASFQENIWIEQITAPAVYEVSFWIKLNIIPGTYFLNIGIGGEVNGEPTYLHRQVDICMVKVLPPNDRLTYGIAYLEPMFTFRCLSCNPEREI